MSSSREVLAVDLGPHQVADQVVARLGPALLHHLGEVVPQGLRRRHAAVPVGRHARELERPALEPRVVVARQAEDARDDLHREVEGDGAHEVGAALAR